MTALPAPHVAGDADPDSAPFSARPPVPPLPIRCGCGLRRLLRSSLSAPVPRAAPRPNSPSSGPCHSGRPQPIAPSVRFPRLAAPEVAPAHAPWGDPAWSPPAESHRASSASASAWSPSAGSRGRRACCSPSCLLLAASSKLGSLLPGGVCAGWPLAHSACARPPVTSLWRQRDRPLLLRPRRGTRLGSPAQVPGVSADVC